jgi:hypothetical protein
VHFPCTLHHKECPASAFADERPRWPFSELSWLEMLFEEFGDFRVAEHFVLEFYHIVSFVFKD